MTDAAQEDLPGLLAQAVDDRHPAGTDDELFDWFTNNEDVVVEAQASIAIYRNRRNHIIVRAERQVEGDDDVFISIATEPALRAVIARLQHELKAGF